MPSSHFFITATSSFNSESLPGQPYMLNVKSERPGNNRTLQTPAANSA